MLQYGFSQTHIFPYNDRIVNSDLIRGHLVQRKPLFYYILRNAIGGGNIQERVAVWAKMLH